jgi:glutamate racemase
MSDSRPIGVFDSGVGGVTVLQELRRQLPREGLLYLADLAKFPYGPRPLAEVRERALSIIEFLGGFDTKLVVVACNTATAAALNIARERFDIPIVGVIAPGAQAGATATRNGRVAVISTQATLDSGEYVHAIREANPGVVVLGRSAPELVDIVEAGDADTARADAALQPIVTDIAAWGADTLVLGCTHYPLLRPSLRRVLGRRRWRIIDSAETTAARVRRILAVNRLGNDDEGSEAQVETLVTDAPQRFVDTAARLFGDDLPTPRLVDVPSPHMTLAVAR